MWGNIVILFVFVRVCSSRYAEVETLSEDHVKIVALNETDLKAEGADVARIVGGVDTNIERFPYTVQVLRNNRLACGGIIMTSKAVLSTAHCFIENNILLSNRLFYIRAGASSYINTDGQRQSVTRITIHERYKNRLSDNDLAVLTLYSRLSFSSSVAQASILEQGTELPDGTPLTNVGWGYIHTELETIPNHLQAVTVYSVNQQQCADWYSKLGGTFKVTTSMLCSDFLEVGDHDLCQGDSTGPLVLSNGVVVGVTSWGYGCMVPWLPAVNGRISSYTDWIVRTVQANNVSASRSNAIFLLVGFIISALRLL